MAAPHPGVATDAPVGTDALPVSAAQLVAAVVAAEGAAVTVPDAAPRPVQGVSYDAGVIRAVFLTALQRYVLLRRLPHRRRPLIPTPRVWRCSCRSFYAAKRKIGIRNTPGFTGNNCFVIVSVHVLMHIEPIAVHVLERTAQWAAEANGRLGLDGFDAPPWVQLARVFAGILVASGASVDKDVAAIAWQAVNPSQRKREPRPAASKGVLETSVAALLRSVASSGDGGGRRDGRRADYQKVGNGGQHDCETVITALLTAIDTLWSTSGDSLRNVLGGVSACAGVCVKCTHAVSPDTFPAAPFYLLHVPVPDAVAGGEADAAALVKRVTWSCLGDDGASARSHCECAADDCSARPTDDLVVSRLAPYLLLHFLRAGHEGRGPARRLDTRLRFSADGVLPVYAAATHAAGHAVEPERASVRVEYKYRVTACVVRRGSRLRVVCIARHRTPAMLCTSATKAEAAPKQGTTHSRRSTTTGRRRC
jgi:hypothetical protein